MFAFIISFSKVLSAVGLAFVIPHYREVMINDKIDTKEIYYKLFYTGLAIYIPVYFIIIFIPDFLVAVVFDNIDNVKSLLSISVLVSISMYLYSTFSHIDLLSKFNSKTIYKMRFSVVFLIFCISYFYSGLDAVVSSLIVAASDLIVTFSSIIFFKQRSVNAVFNK